MGFSQSSMAKRRGAFPDGFFSLSSVSSVVNKKFYGGFCRTVWRKMADFVGLVADYGNGKKDGYGIFSILNGKTPRRIS